MTETRQKTEQAEEPSRVDGVVILANEGRNYLRGDKTWSRWDPASNGNSNQLRVWTLEQARELYTESRGTGEYGEDGWETEPSEVLEATWEKGHLNANGEDAGTTLSTNRFPIFEYLQDHSPKTE